MTDADDVFLQSSPEPDLFIYPSQVHPTDVDAITVDLLGDGVATLSMAVAASRDLTADGAGVASGTLDVTLATGAVGVGVVDFSYILIPYVPPSGGGGGGNSYPTRLRPTEPDRCEDPDDCRDPEEDLAILLILGAL